MKNLKEIVCNESASKNLTYRVEFADIDGLPVKATIILDDEDDVNVFDKYLNEMEGEIFMHASGHNGNVEY